MRSRRTKLGDVGLALDSGVITGAGLGKFFGQGRIHIRQQSGGIFEQFRLLPGTNSGQFKIGPGSVNNIVAGPGEDMTLSSITFVYLDVTTSSGVVSSATIASGASITPQSATTDYPPPTIQVPLYKKVGTTLYRVLGAFGIELFANPAGLTAQDPFKVRYVWGVIG